MVFDVKMEFIRKSWFVSGGHKTEPPESVTYASVVSRDNVRGALLLSSLNDIDVLSTDI